MASRRAPSPALPWASWEASIHALISSGQLGGALLTIERALDDRQDAEGLLALLLQLEEASPGGTLGAPGLRLKVRLLGNVHWPGALLALVRDALASGESAPYLHAFLAWALVQEEDFPGALHAADEALHGRAQLHHRELGLALRSRGYALNRLDPQGPWAAAFEEALSVTEGAARGLVLLDLGCLHSRAGHEGQALLAFAEALDHVADAGLRAQLLNNMGLACLRAGRFAEAEGYFTRVTRLRSGFRSRALSGLGASRRALGEWARAEHLYQQAEAAAQGGAGQAAVDADDLRQARRGLGHTQRLAGRPMQALETLRAAARTTPGDVSSGVSWVNVDVAAALVSLKRLDARAVLETLDRTGPLDCEDAERAVIVRAELARRTGDASGARALVLPLERSSLWLREEAHAFADLFALLPAEERPEPLPRPAQTQVHLRALGLPDVRVNGRSVQLGPLELATLAALLLAGGTLSTDELTEVIRDGRPRAARQASQRVSKVVARLRDALGWPQSVDSRMGAYQLDPHTRWSADVLDGAQNRRATEFLSGVHLPWVIEQEQHLIHFDSDSLL